MESSEINRDLTYIRRRRRRRNRQTFMSTRMLPIPRWKNILAASSSVVVTFARTNTRQPPRLSLLLPSKNNNRLLIKGNFPLSLALDLRKLAHDITAYLTTRNHDASCVA